MATMLFTASCSEQELVDPSLLNGDAVTFTVNLQQSASTRAALAGSGAHADKLYYGVYEATEVDANGNGTAWQLVPAISAAQEEGMKDPADISTGNANVEIKLAKQKLYSVIFWATNENNDVCDVDWANRTMTMKATGATANNEANDAFWAYETVRLNGAVAKTVDLYRPFAQLNIGVSDEDYQAAIDASVELQNSAVTVRKVPTTMNLANGEVSGCTETSAVAYASAAIPTSTDWTFPVSNNKYLALNYVLVGGGADQSLIDVELSYTDNENGSYSSTFTSVPVRRNYRTNIYGNLLTSDADYSVKIEAGIDGEVNSKVEVALQLAAQAGGTFTLTENLELTSPLTVTADFVLNLNGKTISGDFSDQTKTVINNTGKLTLIGGEIKNIATNGAAVITNSGKLVLKDVTINGAPIGTEGYPSYAVYSSGELTIEEGTTISSDRGCLRLGEDGKTVINGGTFTNKDISPRTLTSHVVDVESNGKNQLTINGGTFQHLFTKTSGGVVICNRTKETVYVNGGNFSGGNYYGNNNLSDYGYGGTFIVTGGTYSAQPAAKYIATGYKAIEKDGKWYVVPAEVTAVADSEAEIRTALKQANAVVYVYPTEDGSSYKLEGKLSLAEGVKLIGAGDEPVALFNDWGSNAFANQAHFTNTHIENVYFSNNLVIDAGIANGNVTFKGCVFGGDLAHQGVHFDSGNGTITFDDCTFVGRNMFGSSLEKVIFNNCKFENKKSSQTGADKWTGVNMWGKYEFNNCEFDTEATCNVKCDGVIADFNNCFYSNGKDIKAVISNSPAYTCTITVDGIVVGGYATTEILNKEGVTYTGDWFENSIDNALYFKNWILEGDATIKVVDKTYSAIILEGVKANLNGNAIEIDNENNSVMVLDNCNFTLAEGKKLIKSTKTIYQVYMVNITVNGVKLTQDNAAQYLENVGWYQVVDPSLL